MDLAANYKRLVSEYAQHIRAYFAATGLAEDDETVASFTQAFGKDALDFMKQLDVQPEAVPLPKKSSADLDSAIDEATSLGGTSLAIWSVFDAIGHMDEIAFKGVGLELLYDVHWGPKPVKIALPDNPTWNDLLKSGDEAIVMSGDQHHVFVESFKLVPGTRQIRMTTGS